MKAQGWFLSLIAGVLAGTLAAPARAADRFEGEYFAGEGDAGFLQLFDVSRRMLGVDPEFQHIAMLYTPVWNGLVEGPTWGAWWIQNSYGPTYCALPFYLEPYTTFLQHSQDLWFDQMGDGRRAGAHDWVAPDGSLCDAAAPGWIVYKQGDGRIDIHDWGMEFTAAGLLMQAELLLISRDPEAIAHYLPRLERCANFIETRRDPENGLFLAGPAANLLAPSYAGWKRPDGSYDMAYLTGLSVSYIAALDRLIEVQKLAGQPDKAAMYAERRDRARAALPQLTTDEGYFIKSLDPDGTRHGVFGADRHGYFESSPNHDAIAFRVVDDAQARRIYDTIASIPGLRRHSVIIANEPGLDDMYDPGTSWLWQHGTWVNGGHWSTCEARMMLGYFRLARHDDARRSMEHMLGFARRFRMDNPLVAFGSEVYQPNQPINLCYDSFGPPAAMLRGLFEYLYRADELVLVPHIPPDISRLEQRFPVRFGTKRLYLMTVGSGPVTGVFVNGEPVTRFDEATVTLRHDDLPEIAHVTIALGGAEAAGQTARPRAQAALPAATDPFWDVSDIAPREGMNNLPMRLGADSQTGNRLHGSIARAQVFDRPLSAPEVAALTRGEQVEPGPLAAWVFEGDTHERFRNTAGDGLNARTSGAVSTVEGPDGGALQLGGEGWVEVDHDTRLHLDGGFTLAATIRIDAPPPEAGMRIIDKIPVGTSDGYLLDMPNANTLRVITSQGALSRPADIVPGRWYHLAATFAPAGEICLYIDGALLGSRAADPPAGPVSPTWIPVFHDRLAAEGLADCYEARHAALVAESIAALRERRRRIAAGELSPLPEPSHEAADRSYVDTVIRLRQGFESALRAYADSDDAHRRRVYEHWRAATGS